MHVPKRLLFATLIGLILSSAAIAGSLTGLVRDSESQRPLRNATVTIESIGRSTSTDQNGAFSISNVPAGTYEVTVRYLGLEDSTQSVAVGDATATRADFDMGYGDVIKLENFVVEGIREGQAMALQQKRTAANIIDVVSADAVGKFPDGNAAESLRRMPGLSVEIDQDEGRYVVVRGIDSALNNVTLNSQVLGTPSEQGNRGVAMDSVPADLISRLEVSKAVTPDLDGTAIGGSINIVTKSAFETPGQFLYGSIAGFYDSFSKRYSPNGSLTYGRVLGDAKTWGAVVGASYSKKRFQSQTSDNIDWTLINNILAPTTQESFNYDIMRERIGVNVALENRPNENTEFALRFNHNEFTDEEGRQKFGYNFIPGEQYVTNQTATSGTVSRGRSTREFRSYHQTGTIRAVSLSGKHKLASDYELSWQVGGSRGERDVPKRDDWEYRSSATAFPSTYDLSGESAVITPSANFYDPARYPFRRVRFRHDLEQEDVLSAQIDLKRDVEWGGKQGYWKVGAKFVSREKEDDRENENYNLAGSANSFTLAQPGLAGVFADSLINREPPYYFRGRFPFGPTIHLENNEAFFAANPSRFAYDPAGSLDNSLGGDYQASEDVLAAYAMGNVQLTPKVTVLGGVRVEHTKGDYVANYDNDGTWIVDGSTGSVEYTTVMPGVHFVWRPNDRMVVRFAWTNTLGRPSYSLLAPIKVFETDEILDEDDEPTGTFRGGLETGNPELKPYESMNFDLSWEYYLPNAGILSVGAFHKSIDNPVYDNSSTFSDFSFEGQTYRSFTISRPENADSGKVTGVEFNYQQFFTFLPSPFDGLGVNLNYTITDSSATLLIDPQRDVPFFKQSDKIGNFSIVYEKYGWEARVSLAYNGPYITSISNVTMIGDERVNPADFDIYNDSRTVIDAKVSYRINEHFTVFGELININEEPLKEYTGISSRNTGNEIYDWKARFGVNFRL